MEKSLAVPPKHGPKTKTPRVVARRSTERKYYITAIMRINLKSSGQKRKESKPSSLKNPATEAKAAAPRCVFDPPGRD
jgi:hypothetical protein